MYFFGIEIAYSKYKIVLSQWKYAFDLLHETSSRLLGYKPMRTPIDTDTDLWDETGLLFENVFQYMRLIGKFICLTVARSDITYVVGLVG